MIKNYHLYKPKNTQIHRIITAETETTLAAMTVSWCMCWNTGITLSFISTGVTRPSIIVASLVQIPVANVLHKRDECQKIYIQRILSELEFNGTLTLPFRDKTVISVPIRFYIYIFLFLSELHSIIAET